MEENIKNCLYILLGETQTSGATPIQDKEIDRARLWHLRLGHIGEKSLKEL